MSLFFTTQEIISQLTDVLANISEDAYTKPVDTLSSATVGQHIRHLTEFYQCLIKGTSTGIIDYDRRVRDRRLEENKEFALLSLHAICIALTKVKTEDKLLMAYYGSSENDSCDYIPTSFERELAYNIEHMIHHMALIRIGVKCLNPAYMIPENFGVAASTIKYRRQNVHGKLSA